MLLEDCPSKILTAFNVDSLEDVHLTMSKKQDQVQSVDNCKVSFDQNECKKKQNYQESFKLRNIKALLIKNLIQLNRT